MKKKKKIGRPESEDPRTEKVLVSLTLGEKHALLRAAGGVPLATWIRVKALEGFAPSRVR